MLKLTTFILVSLVVVISVAKENSASIEPDRNAIRETFSKNSSDILACSKENPSVQGQLTLDFEIDENGKATNVKANKKSSVVKDEKMVKCLADKMKSWNFPKSPRGQIVNIVYPLVFSQE